MVGVASTPDQDVTSEARFTGMCQLQCDRPAAESEFLRQGMSCRPGGLWQGHGGDTQPAEQ